jgi:hypothetical protein
MKIKTFIAAALLSLGLLSTAQAETVSKAYEVALDEFRAPVNINGTAAFKPCGDCGHTVLRVTASTRYVINEKDVNFADFRKALKLANKNTTDLVVLHHLESNTIKTIYVSL